MNSSRPFSREVNHLPTCTPLRRIGNVLAPSRGPRGTRMPRVGQGLYGASEFDRPSGEDRFDRAREPRRLSRDGDDGHRVSRRRRIAKREKAAGAGRP